MYAAANNLRGGVSPRGTLLRGQGIIEYVLIIAIIVLVVLIAGPWVSSAIRNQFNVVASAIGSGTTGENFYEPEDIPDPHHGTAFAVYSEDDHSLMFYKRRGLPQLGDMFNYRRVTAVYTGFEGTSYHILGYDPTINNWDTCDTTTPWFNVRKNVTSIDVVDRGIKPYNLAFFFRRFENLETADLGNFDLSGTVSINSMFTLCKSLRSAKVPGVSRQCTEFKDAFACCPALTDLELGNSDFSGGTGFYHMFNGDGSLSFDCTDWNVPSDVEHGGFNSGAYGVVLPKAWQ